MKKNYSLKGSGSNLSAVFFAAFRQNYLCVTIFDEKYENVEKYIELALIFSLFC